MNHIVMPKLGLTMTEGTLASWNVGPGDEVCAGDVIFVVETDKIATEITANAGGRIVAIEVAQGETVPVGAVIATWTGPAEGPSQADTAAETGPYLPGGRGHLASPRPFSAPAAMDGARIVSTPYARRLARSRGLDLHGIKGSGPSDRVKAADLKISARRAPSNIEKTVARRLTAAKQEIPHFYVMTEADVTALIALRSAVNSDIRKTKISLNHLILLATGRALQENDAFNIVWDNEEIVTLEGSDIGFAVDTPKGLFAPVLRMAGRKCLDELAREANDLAELAHTGNLRAEHLSGAAVTVSNVGMHGASWIFPIVNRGQSSIIGIGAAKPQFRPDATGSPSLRQSLALVLSGDHRVLDGVKGARFLNAIVHLLENPAELVS